MMADAQAQPARANPQAGALTILVLHFRPRIDSLIDRGVHDMQRSTLRPRFCMRRACGRVCDAQLGPVPVLPAGTVVSWDRVGDTRVPGEPRGVRGAKKRT